MKKTFYDPDGNPINYTFNPIYSKEGSQAHIYRISTDSCLKVYKRKTKYNPNIIEQIQSMKLNNIYEIYRLLYDKEKNFKGYEMKYYRPDIKDILTVPVDYTLENLESIIDVGQRLGKSGILVNDLHDENTILTRDKIVLIDIDDYCKATLYKGNQILSYNYREVMFLFFLLYINAINEYHPEARHSTECVKELFTTEQNINKVHKTLKKYKYPIDYIRSY